MLQQVLSESARALRQLARVGPRGSFAGSLAPVAATARGFCEGATPAKAEAKGKGDDCVGQPVQGINYKKGGADPLIKADEEYPEWLWTMLDPKPTLSELERRLGPVLAKEINGIGDLRKLWQEHNQDIRRYAKLLGTARVRENNSRKAK